MENIQDCIQDLIKLMELRKDLKEGLEKSIKRAKQPDVKRVEDFYVFANDVLTRIPTQREMDPLMEKFYYLIKFSPDDILKQDSHFRQWMVSFSKNYGSFLDTPESAKALDTFIANPAYNIQEYDIGPSGWLTFNQFFARHVKAGKRPVAERCNNNVIVSTTDSVYQGAWPIDKEANVTTKGKTYSIMELLDGSPYQEKFVNGVFTHSYLNINDYHRFHVPVSGIIREVKLIPGYVMMDVFKRPDGTIDSEDDLGFQFSQTRGLIVIETPNLGFVAVVPVGMAHVSSVHITAEEGVYLDKGEEFGYFCFGGSDMVMLFEPNRVKFTATLDKHYKQGEKIAQAIKSKSKD